MPRKDTLPNKARRDKNETNTEDIACTWSLAHKPLTGLQPDGRPCEPLPATNETKASQVDSYNHNAGIYVWSHGSTWTLIETFYDPNANHHTPSTGDLWIPSSGNGGGGGGGGGGGYVVQDCGQLLETITVSAAGFSGGMGLHLVRTVHTGSGGGAGGGSLTRSPTSFIRNVDADQNLDCDSDFDDRELSAFYSIASGGLTRGLYRVNYGNGDYQMWVITNPQWTNGGIQASGSCIRG